MRHSLEVGFCFGLTSGIITTLGLMVGLHSGTHSQAVVIGGILTIAIADAFSDALGIHISEESEGKHTAREVWESTVVTFATKFFFALTFLIPVLLFNITTAIIVSINYGLLALCILSYFLAKKDNKSPLNVITEHLLIAIVVIMATHLVGKWIGVTFV